MIVATLIMAYALSTPTSSSSAISSGSSARRRIRIFLSSPSDVFKERIIAFYTIKKIQRNFVRYCDIEAYNWEVEPMLASGHFQDLIDRPANFDIVIVILWSRMGTPLPAKTSLREYRGLDGRTPVTGTEWEFEDALAANRATQGLGPPDLLVYRRNVEPRFKASTVQEEQSQYHSLNLFWRRWFEDEGRFQAGFQRFSTEEEFEAKLERDVSKLIERHIETKDAVERVWFGPAPFKGLLSYQFGDSNVFFARDAEIQSGLSALHSCAADGTAFLLIRGGSGTGKSSIARAGLLPALVMTKATPGVGLWRRAIMRPGDAGGDPIRALALALAGRRTADGEGLPELLGDSLSVDDLYDDLLEPGSKRLIFKRALAEAAAAARTKGGLLPHDEAKLVLLVDQLEELFDGEQRLTALASAFADLLLDLSTMNCVYVVATIRADLMHLLDCVKSFAILLRRGGRLAILPPDSAQLLEIIQRPAEIAGLRFDKDPTTGLGIDAMLTASAAAQSYSLPLISVFMEDLYRADIESGRDRSVLTAGTYHKLGGLLGAIGHRAELVMQALSARDLDAAAALPKVLRALTKGAKGDASTLTAATLARYPIGSPEERLIRSLGAPDARLLTIEDVGRGPEVRIVHQALLEHWPSAAKIMKESQFFQRVHPEVEALRGRWDMERRSEFLLRGLQLSEAETLQSLHWDELEQPTRDFIRRSRRHAQRGIAALVLAVLFLAALTCCLALSSERFLVERDRAERNFEAATASVGSLDHLIYASHQGLQNLVGMKLADIQNTLEGTQKSVDQLIDAVPKDPRLLGLKAEMLANFVDIYLSVSLFPQAQRSGNQGLNVAKDLSALAPGSEAALRAAVVSKYKHGDVEVRAADSLAALQDYEAARDVAITLRQAHPSEAARRLLWVAQQKACEALLGSGRTQEAFDLASKTTAEAQQAAEASPSVEQRRDLSISLATLGDIEAALGRQDDAGASYRDMLKIRRNLTSQFPSNSVFQRDLMLALVKTEDAANLTEALALAKRLASADPSNSQAQRDVAVVLDVIGAANADSNLEAAQAAFEEAATNLRQLVGRDPENVGAQLDLAKNLADFALTLKGGKADAAADAAAKLFYTLEASHKLDPAGEANVRLVLQALESVR